MEYKHQKLSPFGPAFLSLVAFLCIKSSSVEINFFFLTGMIAGIMFQDITTLLLDPQAFKDTIDLFVERYQGKNISVVAGKKGLEKQNVEVKNLFGCSKTFIFSWNF